MGDYLTDVAEEANKTADSGLVVVEGSQATFLSLYLSPDYPYTTSDNCTAMAFADDVGLSWRRVSDVFLLVRTMPIRVGSGPLPYEMASEEIMQRGLQEFGVVTGRPRRKASLIDWNYLSYATMLNSPTEVALTFCDNWDPAITGAIDTDSITNKIKELVRQVEQSTQAPITLLETGKLYNHMIDLRDVRFGRKPKRLNANT